MASTNDCDLATTLAVVAQTLARENELTAVILRTCDLAVETIDACEHADVMVVAPGGGLTVPASTDWVGTRIVSFEDEYGEGPCVDAFRSGTTVDSPDFNVEPRWPKFAQRCIAETLEALASRDLLGQAKGILMTESHITADEAFDMLRRASQRLNRKLVSIAQEIVDKHTAS